MAQDTTPAIVIYQGNGSNKTFSIPFDKGEYGSIKVAFVRRGHTDYYYNPTTYTVDGYLYAWDLGGSPKQYYYTKTNDNKVYNANNAVVPGVTLSSMASSSATFSNGKTGYRAYANDISFHSLLEWLGDTLTVNDWICIVRETQTSQPYTYPNNQKHIEGALDNLSRQVQELKAQSDISLKVDATFMQDSQKMNPIDWLNTIVRSTDGTARGFRYRDMWLEYSIDNPELPEERKSWTRLLNTTNITTVREYRDEDRGMTVPQYSKDGGVTWIDFGAALQQQIDTNRENISKNAKDIETLYGHTSDLYNKHTVLDGRVDGHDAHLAGLDNSVADLYATKIDKDQGKINIGKVLTVGGDGMVVPRVPQGGGSGIGVVAHDNTLIGAGTDEYPLGVKDKVTITIEDWE